MQFSLARRGALKILKGQWTVTAHPTNPCYACIHLDQVQLAAPHCTAGSIKQAMLQASLKEALLFSQEMQPSFVPPPPFRRFMRKAMLGKAAQMLEQMQVGLSP